MKNAKLVLAVGNGYAVPTEEQIPAIARVGFDGIFTGWDDGAPIAAWAELARAHGLLYQSLHAPFTRANTMWEEGKTGEQTADELCRCLDACAENGISPSASPSATCPISRRKSLKARSPVRTARALTAKRLRRW